MTLRVFSDLNEARFWQLLETVASTQLPSVVSPQLSSMTQSLRGSEPPTHPQAEVDRGALKQVQHRDKEVTEAVAERAKAVT